MESLSDRLRSLAISPIDLPSFDPGIFPGDPVSLFSSWLNDAISSGEHQPNVMVLATVDELGAPVCRTMLLTDVDTNGIRFVGTLSIRETLQLKIHCLASVLFLWPSAGRQVEVQGQVKLLDESTFNSDRTEQLNYDQSTQPEQRTWILLPERIEFRQLTNAVDQIRLEYLKDDLGSWRYRTLSG